MPKGVEFIGSNILPIVSYADRKGLPFETMSRDTISERFGRVAVGTYTDEMGKKVSDDTDQTSLMMDAFMEVDGYNLGVLAKHHVIGHKKTPQIERRPGQYVAECWGTSTDTACKRLARGVPPTASGVLNAAGNGIVMKMSPQVFFEEARGAPGDVQRAHLDELTAMTHDSEMARLTTRLHGDVLRYLMNNEYNRMTFLDVVDNSLSSMVGKTKEELSGILRFLFSDKIDSDTILSSTDRRGFYVPHTLAMAYGAVLATDNSGRLDDTVYEAINLGGDTDTIAVVAATTKLFGLKDKLVMPVDFDDFPGFADVAKRSREFTRRALKLDEITARQL